MLGVKYLRVEEVVCRMTGARSSWAAATTAHTISAFSTLKAPTAYPWRLASNSIRFVSTNIVFLLWIYSAHEGLKANNSSYLGGLCKPMAASAKDGGAKVFTASSAAPSTGDSRGALRSMPFASRACRNGASSMSPTKKVPPE